MVDDIGEVVSYERVGSEKGRMVCSEVGNDAGLVLALVKTGIFKADTECPDAVIKLPFCQGGEADESRPPLT